MLLSFAFTAAHWAEYIAGALALIALLLIAWRLSRRPRGRVLWPCVALVATVAIVVGSFEFLATRVEQVTLGSIRQLGLEAHHAGLRTNAIIYDQPVTVTASWKVLPSGFPGSGVINDVTGYLVHKTTTLDAQVAVYGLIDFTTVADKVATINRQARTITLSLPNPAVSENTTYIRSVNGIREETGLLNSVEQSLIGPLEALFDHPQLSFNAKPALMAAEAAALRRAQHSEVLDSCGKQELVQQLTAAFNLTPAYHGYTVDVRWPTPPARGVNCAAMQRQLAGAGE